jgi:hypothetical protein
MSLINNIRWLISILPKFNSSLKYGPFISLRPGYNNTQAENIVLQEHSLRNQFSSIRY